MTRQWELAACKGRRHTAMHIVQVKIFGGYTRFAADLAPPSGDAPARVLLSTLDAAVGAATHAAARGPAHVNCQFREPLGPAAAPWPQEVLRVRKSSCSSSFPWLPAWCLRPEVHHTSGRAPLHWSPNMMSQDLSGCFSCAHAEEHDRGVTDHQGLERWERATAPFTQYSHPGAAVLTPNMLDGDSASALADLRSAERYRLRSRKLSDCTWQRRHQIMTFACLNHAA